MAISFHAGENFEVNDLAGFALGFYGAGGYGTPVQVGAYNDNCFITNSAGTLASGSAIRVDNTKYIDANTVEIAGSDQMPLRELPNYLATLEIRFTNSTPVKVQNGKLKVFNRVDQSVAPANVTVKAALLVHPATTTSPIGTGSLTWSTLDATTPMDFGAISADAISPGDGTSPDGANTVASTHSWFLAISLMPQTIGAKLGALVFSCEFI